MRSDRIIIFDGQCGLCQNSVRRIIARDRDCAFVFVAAESESGRELQGEYSVDSIAEGTLILLEHGRVYKRGDAVLRIFYELRGLRWPARIMSIFPRSMRDGIYNIIAGLRRKWMSDPAGFATFVEEHSERFLGTPARNRNSG